MSLAELVGVRDYPIIWSCTCCSFGHSIVFLFDLRIHTFGPPPPGLADVPILKGQFLLRKRLLRHILKTMLLLDKERIIQRQR